MRPKPTEAGSGRPAARCNGCGRCCDPVVLGFTQHDVRATLPGEALGKADREWVLYDLTPITRAEALDRIGYLGQGGMTHFRVRGVAVTIPSHYFECRNYDRETKQCLIYDRRPPLCAEYPWYGHPPDHTKSLPDECSYIEDVPVELRRKQPPPSREEP